MSSQVSPEKIHAGDFSRWLRQTRANLKVEQGVDVDCRDCTGCCTSSYFIHIRPDERQALAHIPKKLTVPAPGMPKGHVLMGYNQEGLCPMLMGGKCTIYQHRPQTCRNYDCRVFTAAGITAGEADKSTINRRVQLWQFTYPTQRDLEEHQAVQAAAHFILDRAHAFPGGRAPTHPSQVAILALKSFDVFLPVDGHQSFITSLSDVDIANLIVDASRKFDASGPDSTR